MANGPSLTREQVRWAFETPNLKTIAINHVIHWAPWADIWYGADYKFWARQSKTIDGLRVAADADALTKNLVDLRLVVGGEPSTEQYEVGKSTHGGHSGFQALVMAITLGARKVYLLGYDCKPQGRTINAVDKEPELHMSSNYSRWPSAYERLKLPEGVTVVNSTPGSAITCYPFEEVC